MARRRLPVFLRGPEAEALVAAATAERDAARSPSKRAAAERNRLLILAGLYMGLRVSELCKLRIEDVDLEQGMAMILQGKGDKDRGVPVPEKLLAELRPWIGERRSGFLFANPRGGKLSSRTVQMMVRRLAAVANIPRRVKPHTLRHSYATHLLDKGANIREVQELLGHASVATTEIYTHVSGEKLKKVVNLL